MASCIVRVAVLLSVIVSVVCCVAGQSSVAVPVVSAVSGCAGQSGPATFNCQLWGNRLTLTVVGDGLDWSTQLVYVGNSMACQPNAGNSTVMLCDVATYGDYPISADVPLPVSVLSLTTNVRTQPGAATVTFPAYPPVTVTSVSGCDDRGDSKTYNCSTTTAVLTVRGSGFSNGPPRANFQFFFNSINPTWQVQSGITSWSPNSLVVYNDSVLTFNLADLANAARLVNTGQLCVTIQRSYIVMASAPFCLTFIPTVTNSAAAPAVNMSNPVITSVSGCPINRDNATFGCTRNDLTIQGSGFPSRGVLITVGGAPCGLYNAGPPTLTAVTCFLPRQWNGLPSGLLVPVVIQDLINELTSAPYYGAAFTPVAVPYISSISGCQGSGQQTSMCVAATDVLTLSGSGFRQQTEYWNLYFGPLAEAVPSYYATTSSDTIIVLPLNATSSLLASLSQASATLTANSILPVLLIKTGTILSNSLSISLAPLFLNVTRLDGCESQSDYLVTDCTPGVSLLTLFASNIFPPLAISVGGVACGRLQVFSMYVTCVVAAPEGFSSDVGYDLLVTQGVSEIVLPGAVHFTGRPTIQTVTSAVCASDYLSPTSVHALDCAAGDVVTLVGSFFTYSPLFQVRLTINNGVIVGLCEEVTLLSAWTLQCTLPAVNASQAATVLGQDVAMVVFENDTSSSNPLSTRLYRAATDVGVTGISGCTGSDPSGRGAQGCVTGSVITVSGQNFVVPVGGTLQVVLYELSTQVVYQCQLPSILSSTQLTCRLPYIALLESELPLPLRVQMSATRNSNWFIGVGYSAGLSDSMRDGGGSTNYRAAFIAAVVLLGVESLLTTILLVALCRRVGHTDRSKKSLHNFSSRSDSGDQDVEQSSRWPVVEMR